MRLALVLLLSACGGALPAAAPDLGRPCGSREQRCCGYEWQQYIPDGGATPWCDDGMFCTPTFDGAGNPAPATCQPTT